MGREWRYKEIMDGTDNTLKEAIFIITGGNPPKGEMENERLSNRQEEVASVPTRSSDKRTQ